ncbi:MAG: MFS transporter [Chloroflexota bacterium]|nr:MFS transporter [Chloroflexota bacterium]
MRDGRSETRSGPHSTLKTLWRAVFWVSFPFGILSFVLPIYGRELGASALEVGGFFSAASLVPLVVRPFLGRVLDRWGRRPFLLLGLFGYTAAVALFCAADTVQLLTLARFVQGLGQAFLWISAYTIVADVARKTGRGRSFGRIDEAVNRGALIGTTAGFTTIFALASLDLEWRQIWFWLFAAYLPAALISSFLPSRMGRVADRLGRKGPMISGLVVGALVSVLIPHLPGVMTLAALWAVESLGRTISLPAERAFVADIAGENMRGTSYGPYTFAYFLGSGAGPLVGGWLYDYLGHATPFYLNTSVLCFGALLVMLVLREPRVSDVDQPRGTIQFGV